MKRSDGPEEPPFTAPWQAQLFALTVRLNETGVFSWTEWARVFSEQRGCSAQAGITDLPDQYYEDWLAALERMLIDKGRASSESLAALEQAWIEAYERTPHGKPVRLETATERPSPPAATRPRDEARRR